VNVAGYAGDVSHTRTLVMPSVKDFAPCLLSAYINVLPLPCRDAAQAR